MYKGTTYLCFESLKRYSRYSYCSLRKDGFFTNIDGVIGYQYLNGCKIEIFEDDHYSLIDSSISIDDFFHSSVDDTKENSLKHYSRTPHYNNKSLILDSDTKGLDQ